LDQSISYDRHLKKQRWKRRRRAASSISRLVKVELAAKKSPAQHEVSCGLAVVLPDGRQTKFIPTLIQIRSSDW